jgi:glycine/D-amino acid oxidase-like deaminating enzyme
VEDAEMTLRPEGHPSIWMATSASTEYPRLEGRVEADVAVIGAGITGLAAGALLAREGLEVVVVEARRIASGTTGYTTAKVTSLHGLAYAEMAVTHGEDHAGAYGMAAQSAIDEVAAFVSRDGIECDFERMPAVTYTQDPSRVDAVTQEADMARRLGLPAHFTTETDLPYPVDAAVRFDDQAAFHPRKFCAGLARLIVDAGGRVFEGSRATGLEPGDPANVITDGGEVMASHVIQATHLPFHDPGLFFAKTAPYRSYAVAARVSGPVPQAMYLSADTPTRSVRAYRREDETYLILGGEGHKVGQDADTEARYAALETWANDAFGIEQIDYRWSAQDYVPADGVPYIGSLSSDSERLWVATGFKKWGMTTGMVAAMTLRDRIVGRDVPWGGIFDATRLKPGASAKSLLQENADVVRRFVGDRVAALNLPDAAELAPGAGAIARLDGERVAAYRDGDGTLHAVSAACTHLGCLVAFNTAEKTWDCPCHGSRFDVDGDVIQGPAVRDLVRADLTQA